MRLDDFLNRRTKRMGVVPVRVMRLEFFRVADIPDVVANPILIRVRHVHLPFGQLLDQRNRFNHRAVAVSTPARVVDLAASRVLMKVPEHFDQIRRVNVVSNLLPLIAVDRVLVAGQRTLHEVRQKPVQPRSRMTRPSQTAASKARRLHPEVATVFLNEGVSGKLGNSEQRMGRMVNGHGLVDALLRERMRRIDFPASIEFNQRQLIRIVAVDLVGRRVGLL